jgi:hypothetical protein
MRSALVACVVLLAALLVISARAATGCRRDLALARGFVSAADEAATIVAARHAASWYLPGDRCTAEALDLLEQTGRSAEQQGRPGDALEAYRAARTAIMLTRGLWVPHRERLDGLHASIARLMAATRDPANPAESEQAAAARFRAQLDGYESRRPRPWLGLLGSLSFVGWIAAMFRLAGTGLTPDGRLVGPRVWLWGGVSVAAFVTWLLAVRHA